MPTPLLEVGITKTIIFSLNSPETFNFFEKVTTRRHAKVSQSVAVFQATRNEVIPLSTLLCLLHDVFSPFWTRPDCYLQAVGLIHVVKFWKMKFIVIFFNFFHPTWNFLWRVYCKILFSVRVNKSSYYFMKVHLIFAFLSSVDIYNINNSLYPKLWHISDPCIVFALSSHIGIRCSTWDWQFHCTRHLPLIPLLLPPHPLLVESSDNLRPG